MFWSVANTPSCRLLSHLVTLELNCLICAIYTQLLEGCKFHFQLQGPQNLIWDCSRNILCYDMFIFWVGFCVHVLLCSISFYPKHESVTLDVCPCFFVCVCVLRSDLCIDIALALNMVPFKRSGHLFQRSAGSEQVFMSFRSGGMDVQRLHVLLSFVFRKCPSLLFFSQMNVEDSAPFFHWKTKCADICMLFYFILFSPSLCLLISCCWYLSGDPPTVIWQLLL